MVWGSLHTRERGFSAGFGVVSAVSNAAFAPVLIYYM